MEFIKLYIIYMFWRWQPHCSVIKPCICESTQNSAPFYLKFVKSTPHRYDTYFNALNVSTLQSTDLLLQNCPIFWRSGAMDYGIFDHTLLKPPADFFFGSKTQVRWGKVNRKNNLSFMEKTWNINEINYGSIQKSCHRFSSPFFLDFLSSSHISSKKPVCSVAEWVFKPIRHWAFNFVFSTWLLIRSN